MPWLAFNGKQEELTHAMACLQALTTTCTTNTATRQAVGSKTPDTIQKWLARAQGVSPLSNGKQPRATRRETGRRRPSEARRARKCWAAAHGHAGRADESSGRVAAHRADGRTRAGASDAAGDADGQRVRPRKHALGAL
eukprot:509338-Prymnesium_polylepis.2